jgi:hypothetical protein
MDVRYRASQHLGGLPRGYRGWHVWRWCRRLLPEAVSNAVSDGISYSINDCD